MGADCCDHCDMADPHRGNPDYRGGSNMADLDFSLTRRSALFAAVASLVQTGTLFAGEKQVITVHKDPTCGCCSGWVQHLQNAGFVTKVFDTGDIDAVKKRLGVPDDLAACHTAEVAGYIIEGHVPAAALKRASLPRNRTRPASPFPACPSARRAWRAAGRKNTMWCCSRQTAGGHT